MIDKNIKNYRARKLASSGYRVPDSIVEDLKDVGLEVDTDVEEAGVSFNNGKLTFGIPKPADGKDGKDGKDGAQGASAVFDPDTGNILATLENTTGTNDSNAMTQKAVTEALCKNDMPIRLSALLPVAKKYLDANSAWASSNNMGCTIVPVNVGDIYKITANANSYTAYAFLTSNATSGSNLVANTSRVVISANTTKIVEIPSTCTHLYLTTTASGNDATPAVMQLKYIKDTIIELDTNFVKEIPYVVDTVKNGSIDGTTGKWDAGSNSTQYSIIPIEGGKTYVITPYTSGTLMSYTFLTDKTLANNTTPSYAAGYTNRAQASGNKIRLKAPSDANYFAYMSKYSGNDRTLSFFGIEETLSETVAGLPKELNKERTIGVKMQIRRFSSLTTAAGTDGEYAAASAVNIFSTPKMYVVPVDGVVKVKITASGTAVVYGYDIDRTFISKMSSVSVTKDTEFTVNLDYNYSFFKIGFTADAIDTDVYPDLVYAKLTGHFPKECETYNFTQKSAKTDGSRMIPLTIAVDTPDPTSQDTSTATLSDIPNIEFDHGILALPPTYTADGDPTRLIIFCHGAGKKIKQNASGFPDGEYGVDPTYWLSEGYAVMDMDGYPGDTPDAGDNSPQHWCTPVAYQCYLAAYKFVINNYNICKDGIFLGGRSMGGGMALIIMANNDIPVLACCPFACMHPNTPALLKNRTTAEKEFIANACGFYNPENTEWPDQNVVISNDNILPLVMLEEVEASNDKMRYIGNFGRLMQCSPLYKLVVNCPSAEVMMQADIQNSVRSKCSEVFGSLIVKTGIPTKFFGAYDDNTAGSYWVNLWVKMFRNGGCTVEQRMFPTGGHPFDLDDDNLLSTFVNSKGEELTDVPIAYIEALQFWRRYE